MAGASASISGDLSHGTLVFDRAEPPADHHREGASERKTEAKAAVPDSVYSLAPRCLVHTAPPLVRGGADGDTQITRVDAIEILFWIVGREAVSILEESGG